LKAARYRKNLLAALRACRLATDYSMGDKTLRSLQLAAALPALLCVSTQVSAETRLVELPSRYLVIPPSEAFTKRLRVPDDVLNVPLRWEKAAVLSQAVDVAADDRRVSLTKGQALVETRLQFDDQKFSQAGAFCVPRVADPIRKNGLLALGMIGSMLARSTTDGQLCLVDVDRDGVADHSVLVNAGSPAARAPVPITATPYVLTPGAAVSEGDFFRIFYRGGSYFEMGIVQQGHARRFDTLTFKGPSGKENYRKGLRVVKMPDGSVRVPVPGVVFTASNYDKASDSIEIVWPTVTQAVALPIPDVIKESNGFSY
jgi:hypothetical protein